jgi:hypothetical protein
VPWPEVDAFLAQKHRESPGIEYRQKIDPSGKGLTRFVDTVGAMANSGGGLILLGVEADRSTDRPRRWPTLQVGEVKAQTLEAQVRGNVRPYVPIEIAPSIETRGAMEVLVVRVPDVWPKPVFVNESGILHRLAEANVLAPVEAIRTWLEQVRPSANSRIQAMWVAVGHLSGNVSPIFNILVGASRPWYRRAWGDDVDAVIDREVHRAFSDVGDLAVSEQLVQFLDRAPDANWTRRVWCDPNGWVLRGVRPPQRPDRALNAQFLAGEIRRTWELGTRLVPQILPDYSGDFDLILSMGGVHGGLLFAPAKDVASNPPMARPISPQDAWRGEFSGLSMSADSREIVHRVMTRLLRGFGYTGTDSWVAQLADLSAFEESYDDVGPAMTGNPAT